jgi:replicative DNA helicase
MNAPVKIIADIQDERFLTEVELLGALLSETTCAGYHAAATIVGPEHFSGNFNARLFARLGQGIDQGLQGFPLVAWLISSFRDDATLSEVQRPASVMVARYVAMACPGIGIEGWARQIRHDSLKVDLNRAVEEADTAAAEAIAAEMERLSKAHLAKDEGIQHIGQAAGELLDNLSQAYAAGGAIRDFAFAGSRELAGVIGGWRRGRFYVIAGRPGMGKTTTGLSWLLRTALKGHGVMFVSLEMSRAELTEIALCDLAWSRDRRIEYREISATATTWPGFEDRFSAISEASHRFTSMPFMISDKGGQSIADIRSQAMQYAQRLESQGKRLEVICIDHLNLIRASDRYQGSKTAETEEVSAALKQLAKELRCAVICLCQLNRAVEGREEKRPNLSDLRWSGAIEQDADVVMFVYREAYYLERTKHDDLAKETDRLSRFERTRNKLEVTFGKHRGGPCPVLEFYADMGCGVIRDTESRA